MPSPGNNDEPKASGSDMTTLPEPLNGEKDQIEQPPDSGVKAQNRLWAWTESCQAVIEKCDVWTAILKIPQ